MPILHRRSLTSGSIPTTASLAVGQLAINVPDGRIFLRKSGSTDTIESAITTNAPNSGSVSLTGSLSISGSGTVFSAAGDVLEIDSDSAEITGSFIVSGSTRLVGPVTVTGSLVVTAGISGSFSGSGADLFGIPASGIVGLNLSQIASGSYSASISDAGLLVNNRVVADSFTGSLLGTAATSSITLDAAVANTNFQQLFLLMGG